MSEVDLEVLAAGYGWRSATPEAVGRAHALLPAEPGAVAIDVGGGPGEMAAVWARAGARAVVVDPSPAMLAKVPPDVRCIGGRAESLPVADATAAAVMFHMSLHHTEWRVALAEAHRVLRPHGRLGVWTMGADDIEATLMARWFPSTVGVELARFPDPAALRARMRALGFAAIQLSREAEPVARTAGEWQAAVRDRFISTLQLLPPGEVETGLAAFAAAHPDPGEVIRYQRRFTRLLATRG